MRFFAEKKPFVDDVSHGLFKGKLLFKPEKLKRCEGNVDFLFSNPVCVSNYGVLPLRLRVNS